MNLEDYAYNEDGRWYVNPQVSLDEQNAFIDNYRNIEAGNNAQITQQTRDLGTQIPSQLGGLVGGGNYFRSRYQTPQTNQTVADLRATAQAAALQTALQNEIAKKQKQYKDAYRAANERGSNKNDTTSSPLYNTLDDKLKIDVETSVDDTKKTVNDDTVKPGEIGVDSMGRTYYMDWAGRKYLLTSPSEGEALTINPGGWASKPTNGQTWTNPQNGRTYYYDGTSDMWYVLGDRIYD